MMNFIIQVQLHDASPDDIRLFNRKIRREAFLPQKGSTVNSNIRMAYECHHMNSMNEVINSVRQVAAKTGKKISFTVMKDKALGKQKQWKKLY